MVLAILLERINQTRAFITWKGIQDWLHPPKSVSANRTSLAIIRLPGASFTTRLPSVYPEMPLGPRAAGKLTEGGTRDRRPTNDFAARRFFPTVIPLPPGNPGVSRSMKWRQKSEPHRNPKYMDLTLFAIPLGDVGQREVVGKGMHDTSVSGR